MVVNLDLHYLYLASVLMSASTSASASEVNISSSHNSLIFQARRLKFCMVVDLDLLYIYLASVLMNPLFRKTTTTNKIYFFSWQIIAARNKLSWAILVALNSWRFLCFLLCEPTACWFWLLCFIQPLWASLWLNPHFVARSSLGVVLVRRWF